ncbi:MAG: rhomboid family intramembrane serine protease [Bdellovibrionaceae bacterium]|nr:rhomboid family intramembrane serine protease [Pseudobdellovibrionaceae bacterium]
MILPCPENPQSWNHRPITWMLVFLNIAVFLIFFADAPASPTMDLVKEKNLETAGRAFLQMIAVSPEEVREKTPDWIFEVSTSRSVDLQLIGYYAVRQSFFLEGVSSFAFHGDEVALAELRKSVATFQDKFSEDRLHRFGLSPLRNQSFAWLTYQFSHIGFLHLASNLVFLIFIGWAIEGLFGGTVLLILYLMGGIAGGVFFLGLFPGSYIPMVGASGSVSALIAFYALAEPKWRIRYYYLLFPTPGLNGFIYLPTLLILPLYLLADATGLLASPDGLMTGVAYSAHLGGAAFGAIAALLVRGLSLVRINRTS